MCSVYGYQSVEECKSLYQSDISAGLECYAQVAIAKNDINICNQIDREDTRKYLPCYGMVASSKGQVEICDQINSPAQSGNNDKDFCYVDFAFIKQNPTIWLCKKVG